MWSSLSVTCDSSVFFADTPVSSANKIDCHDITDILLKVALNTINQIRTLSYQHELIHISTHVR
jgi:hypothetical protein